MTVIYCANDKRKQVQDDLDLEFDHVFASPTDTHVDYTATHVIIVGSHPQIEKRYKGITSVETLTLDEDE